MSTAKTYEIQRKDLVEGLGKGLKVIETFDDDHPRQTASEVASRTGLSRAAARRHLLSLVHFGYAASDGKLFWLSPRVLRLGQSYLRASRLTRIVQPFIQRIATQSGESVNVSVLDGHDIVYIARSTPPHRYLPLGYAVGTRVPAHVVTPGTVILSTMSNAAIDDWIREHRFVSFTGQTVTDPDKFRGEVGRARALDHACTVGQLDPAFAGISQALVDRKGACQGAIGMTVLASNYTLDAMVAKLLPLLRDAVQTLRALL